jgi:hypothetical protein
MSHSQFHSIKRLYLDMHGLIFETSVCYWQNQPGCYLYILPDLERLDTASVRDGFPSSTSEWFKVSH